MPGLRTCKRCNKPTLKRDLSEEELCPRCHFSTRAVSDIPAKVRVTLCIYCEKPVKEDLHGTRRTWHKECRLEALRTAREEKKEQRATGIEAGEVEPRTCRGCGGPLAWGHGLQWYHEECKLERDRKQQRECQRRYRAKTKLDP